MSRPKKSKPPDPDIEVFELYGKQVRLEYKDSSHRYKVSDNGSKPEQISSVSTVLNVLNKPSLIPWACNQVADYIRDEFSRLISGNSFSVDEVYQIIERGRKASENARQTAADIGTDSHDWLAGHFRAILNGAALPSLPDEGPVQMCTNSVLNWSKEHHVEPIYVEHPVYSRLHKIAGRFDWLGKIDGRISLLDFKSTKQIWPETCLQVTAYSKMHEEQSGQIVEDRWALRMDKLTGQFEDKKYPPATVDEDWDTFLAILKIHNRLKHLRRKEKPEPDAWLIE